MGEQDPINTENTSELYKLFPFLEAFPFDDYRIGLEKDPFNPQALGIDPMIVNNVSGLEMPDVINFFYIESDAQLMISFYRNDLTFLKEKSDEIKVLDNIRKNIDSGLESHSIIDKIAVIKKLKPFVKVLYPGLIAAFTFSEVLNDLLKINNIELPTKLLKSINSMNLSIKEENFNAAELQIIKTFYNFQLHHVKILLGIVISAKIY